MGPRNYALDGGPGPHAKGVILKWKGPDQCKVQGLCVTYAKTAKPIEMPYGVWTKWAKRRTCCVRAHIAATW